jgi:signal transduction histidine kinase
MDSHRIADPLLDRSAPAHAVSPAFARTGLSARLAALRQRIERDHAMVLALDLVNRAALDGLSPDLTDALAAVIEEAATNAALHAGAALACVHVQVNGGMVLLGIEDDGKGFPFAGVYDLATLAALDVGPRRLMREVALWGGTLTLISRPAGTRIDIALPRDAAGSQLRQIPIVAAA